MAKTSTHSTTKAKTLTAITVAAAGVAAYAVATLSTNTVQPPDTSGVADRQTCIQACQARVCNFSDYEQQKMCQGQILLCTNSCPAEANITYLQGDLSVEPLPAAKVGNAYRTRLRVKAYAQEEGTWSVVDGVTPAGMQLDPRGLLYGTPLKDERTRFTVQFFLPKIANVRNEILVRAVVEVAVAPSGSESSGTGSTVGSQGASASALMITTPLKDIRIKQGVPYSLTLAASGIMAGDSAIWDIGYGKLPTGLTLSERGVLSGTPKEVATEVFSVTVHAKSNANIAAYQDARIEVTPTEGTANTTNTGTGTSVTGSTPTAKATMLPEASALPAGRVNVFASFPFSLSGDTSERVWSVDGVPKGMKFDEATHVLYGTPLESGANSIKVSAAKGSDIVTKIYSWNVEADAAPIVVGTEVPDGTDGQSYQATLKAAGGSGSYQWSFKNTAPAGWTLTPAGELKSTAPKAAVYTFLVHVTDASTSMQADAQLTVTIKAATVATTGGTDVKPTDTTKPTDTGTGKDTTATGTDTTKPTTGTGDTAKTTTGTADTQATTLNFNDVGSYPDGFVGFYYNARPFEVVGGKTPYMYRIVTGLLPEGLLMDSNGFISGTPTKKETASFAMTVTDSENKVIRANRVIVIRGSEERTVTTVTNGTGTNTNTTTNTTNSTTAATQARLEVFNRIGVRVHDLVKLQDDGNINTQDDSTVYYLGSDGRRHSFPNPQVYFSWFTDFANVRIIGQRDLADIPLGANITYRPGVRLVKFVSTPSVYVVDLNRRLRLIRTEADAQTIYGTNWAQNVDDIGDAFYMDYRIDGTVDAPSSFRPSALTSSAIWPSDVLPQQ